MGFSGLSRVLQLPGDGQSIQGVDNSDLSRLDLASSIGNSLTLKQLTQLVHPQTLDLVTAAESWDALTPPLSARASPLLRLTHLSLANPGHSASWPALLAFAAATPTITHVSLAYWPTPNLTPNATAINAKMAAKGSPVVNLAAEDRYSHYIDQDFSAAAAILRRLAKRWYSLEYLDVDGCSEWWKALYWGEDDEGVDWINDWAGVKCVYMGGVDSRENTAAAMPNVTSTPESIMAREFEVYVREHRGWIDVITSRNDEE